MNSFERAAVAAFPELQQLAVETATVSMEMSWPQAVTSWSTPFTRSRLAGLAGPVV